jgi:stage V sporulation protein B
VPAASGSEVRNGFSTVTRGTLILIVSTLCLVALNFVSRVILVRSILPDDWSAFSIGLALNGILIAFGVFGLPNAVARTLPYVSTDDERRSIVRGVLILGSLTGGFAGVALWLAAPYLGPLIGPPGTVLALQFFAVGLATSILATIIASIFQGYEDVTPNALFLQIVNPGLLVAFLGAFLLLPSHVLTFYEALVGYAASSLLTLTLSIVYLVRRLPRRLPRGPGAPGALDRLLAFAMPLFVVGVMSSITGGGDTLVLGVFHPGEVGTYTASLTLARLIQIGVSAASYIFLPVAARFLRNDDRASIALTYTTVTKWMVLLSLPLFILFFFLPSESLDFVYTAKYSTVTVPLQLTVIGAFATTLLGPGPTTQVAYGETRLLAYNAIVAGIVDVGLAFALVPSEGYVGAATAWAAAGTVYAALSVIELAVGKGLHPFRHHFVLPLLATAVPVGLAFVILRPTVHLWLLPPIGLAVAGLFITLVLVTRSIDAGDRLLLETVEGLLGRPLPLIRRLGRLGDRTRRLP